MSFAAVDLSAGDTTRGGRSPQLVAIFARTQRAVAVRTGLGILLALGSLALPWIGLTLSPSLSAWNLRPSLAAVPLVHHASYGVLVGSLTLVAVVSFVRSKGQATPCTRAVGWAYLALSLMFFVTTRLIDTATMFTLQNDANQSQIIDSQFLTNNNVPPPSQFLGVSFDAKTLALLYALRLGWYLAPAAGILLAGRIHRPSSRLQWTAWFLSGMALLTVLAGTGLSLQAQSDLDSAIQAVATGQIANSQNLITSALSLNPAIAYDPGLQQAMGIAEANEGQQTGLADYAEATRPVGRDLTVLEKARLFSRAIASVPAGSPASVVIRADLASFLANATITSKNPNLLELVKGQLDEPSVTFSVGRFYYEAGANSLAIPLLQRTFSQTSNGELKSLSLTYIALAWLRLGHEATFRTDIVAAVRDDTLNENVYAREISAGLYVPGTP
jgi:hypothetical protein